MSAYCSVAGLWRAQHVTLPVRLLLGDDARQGGKTNAIVLCCDAVRQRTRLCDACDAHPSRPGAGLHIE